MGKGVLAIPSRVIATCFALIGFATAAIIGLIVGNSVTTIIWRAICVMLICYGIGRLVGWVAQRTVDDHIRRVMDANPIPDDLVDEISDQSKTDNAGQTASSV